MNENEQFDCSAYKEPLSTELDHEDIQRAWLQVTLPEVESPRSPEELQDAACAIMSSINFAYQEDEENVGHWSFGEDLRDFAIRAEIIYWDDGSGGTQPDPGTIVVSINAQSKEQVRAMAAAAKEAASAEGEANVTIAMVSQHFPVNPVRSPAYIATQEENHEPGRKEGYNAWG